MTIWNDEHIFKKDVTFAGNVTFSETPPEISLDNLTNLTGTGTATFADLVATDDLTVGDDATIAGDLAVAGAVACATTLGVTGLSALHNTTVTGTLSVTSTLGVSGVTTLAAASCTTLAADEISVTGPATIGGSLVVDGGLQVNADPTTLHATTVSPGSALTLTGATVVGLHEDVTFKIPSLTGTGRYWLAAPVTGTLVKITSCLDGALTTADAVLTGKIGNTNITNGALTLTQSGSAAGDIQSVSPTAANAVVEGVSKINFQVSGSQGAAVGTTLTLKFLRSA